MGNLVLTRKPSESIVFTNKSTGQSATITLSQTFAHAVSVLINIGEFSKYIEIPYGREQEAFGGTIIFEKRHGFQTVKFLINLPSHMNVVRSELIRK